MKKTLFIAVTVLTLALVLGFVKDNIVKTSLERGIGAMTGLKLEARKVSAGVLNTLVSIEGLSLFNPDGYEDRLMLNAPEVYVDYDLMDIIRGNIHLEEVRLHIEELAVIRGRNGELNVSSITAAMEGRNEPQAKAGAMPDMQIDELALKVDKVVFKDYSLMGVPIVRKFNVNLNKTFTGITNRNQLMSLVVARPLMDTAVSKLAGFDFNEFGGGAMERIGVAEKAAEKTVTSMKAKAKEVWKTGSGILEGAVEEAGGAAEGLEREISNLKEKFKFPVTD